MSIAENLKDVCHRIEQAAAKSGRSAGDVRLIAVSKTKPIVMIEEALRAGQKSFGENYVQEAVEKIVALPAADWHFIGSLQTNKVKQVVGRFSLIHSVDRVRLAEEISKAAVRMNVVQDILIEVNVGGEETKHGVALAELTEVVKVIRELSGVRVRGLMSLPPLTDDERVARGYFRSLRAARAALQKDFFPQEIYFTELSMGTSGDFELAIEEGATMVRIGTTIFGAREN